ncbi:MAG: entericidin [Rhodanobacteraceae bacterium]|nr:entericidin [Rhodanobacteraceae bacterium]MBL0042559.1 entericidin [Xanthomonadales bacterium]MBP6077193.1 hypothetical protein [Xanthomonadales bacterium]MBP7622720.1 hypothetical protein [Xanthomonadales bacterium]
MNTNIRKSFLILLVAGFAVSVGACKTMHGIGEDTEIVGEKIQKEADQHTKDDDNQDNRAHDRS